MCKNTPVGLEERQQVEIEFWRDSPTERPSSDSLENILNKASDAEVFLDCLKRYAQHFEGADAVLELGAGQGWASCIVKRLFPGARVTATDISKWAVASAHKWEHIYEVKLDGAEACKSYEIPREDASVDCVFSFAAAHHFVAHKETLEEVQRVLTPGGHCFYFYEPSCHRALYKMAKRRKNKNRPDVPEDVLVYSDMKRHARSCGLQVEVERYPSMIKRSPGAMLYYVMLNRLPVLQRLLPCTSNYHFRKPEAAAGSAAA